MGEEGGGRSEKEIIKNVKRCVALGFGGTSL